jgi:hypothetical protein
MWKCSAVLLVLCACSDLPAKDDPRQSSEWIADAAADAPDMDATGTATSACNGTPVACSLRTLTDCYGGCDFASGCKSPQHDGCLGFYTDKTGCLHGSGCKFTNGSCQAIGDELCVQYQDSSSCDAAAACLWGSLCNTGVPDQSCGQQDQISCTDVPGCMWGS